MATFSDDEYEIPLRDQRYFELASRGSAYKSAADRYLAIVLGKSTASTQPPARSDSVRLSDHPPETSTDGERDGDGVHVASIDGTPEKADDAAVCAICRRPLDDADPALSHESSIAHQICIEHSHPPSHIDRSRKGLTVLQSQGWNPDSRLGLGASGEGVLHPVKATDHPLRAGVGAKVMERPPKEKPVRLDAGKVRQMDKEAKRNATRLRDAFYRNDEVSRYLGEEL